MQPIGFPLTTAEELTKIATPGIALDIDETLAWTNRDWAERLFERFGPHEDHTPESFVATYPHSSGFPERYRCEEAIEMMRTWIADDAFQCGITPVPGAIEAVTRGGFSISAYITARPRSVHSGTVRWLETHEFPEAPIVMLPEDVRHEDGTKWKAEVLRMLHPIIAGIVDDSHSLAEHLDRDYEGTHYLISPQKRNYSNPNVVHCENWTDVVRKIRKMNMR